MISICLCSSSNIISGLSKGVRDSEGVYQDVLFYSTDDEQMQQNIMFYLFTSESELVYTLGSTDEIYISDI